MPRPKPLLATATGEPFQPVRLYYAVPDAAAVLARLAGLGCMDEVPSRGDWEWLFQEEAATLRLPGTCADIPRAMRPLVIGRIRFPRPASMTLQVNSIPRAIEGARFFGARLGELAVAFRVRVVNRNFAAGEGEPRDLAGMLDRDVVVIDPREGELVIQRMLQALGPEKARQQFAQGRFPGEDVPLVEDFPLHPEEESPDFRQLATLLSFRAVRAMEHWQGRTDLTLGAVIRRAAAQGQGR
jgi:hypothetical protein